VSAWLARVGARLTVQREQQGMREAMLAVMTAQAA
jgi:hypothetical protein